MPNAGLTTEVGVTLMVQRGVFRTEQGRCASSLGGSSVGRTGMDPATRG